MWCVCVWGGGWLGPGEGEGVEDAYNLTNMYSPLFAISNQSCSNSVSPVTSRGQGHSLNMVLDEN